MAIVGKNIITQGLQGSLDDTLVFRRRKGITIVSTSPEKTDREFSEGEKLRHKKFQEAVVYAKSKIADPAMKKAYTDKIEGLESAYNVAVADFFNAPSIDEIDLNAYTGKPGDTIKILATDDFMVVEVAVRIENEDGTLVEEGAAVLTNGSWVFTAKANNASLDGDKIIIRASDMPGNVTSKEEVM